MHKKQKKKLKRKKNLAHRERTGTLGPQAKAMKESIDKSKIDSFFPFDLF